MQPYISRVAVSITLPPVFIIRNLAKPPVLLCLWFYTSWVVANGYLWLSESVSFAFSV